MTAYFLSWWFGICFIETYCAARRRWGNNSTPWCHWKSDGFAGLLFDMPLILFVTWQSQPLSFTTHLFSLLIIILNHFCLCILGQQLCYSRPWVDWWQSRVTNRRDRRRFECLVFQLEIARHTRVSCLFTWYLCDMPYVVVLTLLFHYDTSYFRQQITKRIHIQHCRMLFLMSSMLFRDNCFFFTFAVLLSAAINLALITITSLSETWRFTILVLSDTKNTQHHYSELY